MDLSVVLPTLHKLSTGRLLAARVSELFGASLSFEVVIVTPAADDHPASDPHVRVIKDDGGGIYAAYQQGIDAARGEYVWLIGDDDYPLDAVAELAQTMKERKIDLMVAPVIFSTGRIYHPSAKRLPLMFYNWCQQGVIYRKRLLQQHTFPKRLKIQADHYVNIRLRADPSLQVMYFEQPICVFGANGASSRTGDLRFRALRPQLARRVLSPIQLFLFLSVVRVSDTMKWIKGRLR